MQVHICSPNRPDKNLGKAYNEAISLLPDDYWACLTDLDVQFLTHDAGNILHEYARKFPTAGLLTCFTNRISHLSKPQLLNGVVSEESDIRKHIKLAIEQKRQLFRATPIERDISGFLMMISKKIWREFPFPEDGKCLGVDTNFGRMIRNAGYTIFRMDGLYVFHAYRLATDVKDKTHLL